MLKKISYPSPNFEERPKGISPNMIILHYTDMMSAQEALTRLCDPTAKVSAHFLISKTGDLYQLVDLTKRAWHAGLSSWKGIEDINSQSIGIELDNLGHTFGPEAFPEPQIKTLLVLLEELTKEYGIAPHRILGHSDVAPLRKVDPGTLFPWEHLADKGFGLWPSNRVPDQGPMSILEIQKTLYDIGYPCLQTGIWDEDCEKICQAFQQHFTPAEVTGSPTPLTCQALKGVLFSHDV